MGNGEIFEIAMLICFWFPWPIAIFKIIKAKTVKGKTPLTFYFILIGYAAGIIYKLFFNFNYVFLFYAVNFLTVLIQLMLYYYYHAIETKTEPPQWL